MKGSAMSFSSFWNGKRVFLTGHTGFKGAWLACWLHQLGAKVVGFSRDIPTSPSLFEVCAVEKLCEGHILGDVSDLELLHSALHESKAEIVVHLAAQSLVQYSYRNPVETYRTNVLGTVHLLEAFRSLDSAKAAVVATSDKCYADQGWEFPYRENDQLGGFDPYSNSKACTELVVESFLKSFFPASAYETHGKAIGSGRAGNVIGGGDWSENRLVPDCLRAFTSEQPVTLRNPDAVRPWQHVLEPLYGYLRLAQSLYEIGPAFSGGWNFGPHDEGLRDVASIANGLAHRWGKGAEVRIEKDPSLGHETSCLRLSSAKSFSALGWKPVWEIEYALDSIVEWHRALQEREDLLAVTFEQIRRYEEAQNKQEAR